MKEACKMAEHPSRKTLFLLYKLMMEQTDEKHPMTVSRMNAELERRESVPNASPIRRPAVLAQCCLIPPTASRPCGFYIVGRDFGPTQEGCMVRCSAARFIPPGYSRELGTGWAAHSGLKRGARSEIFVDYPAKHAGEDMPSVMEIIRSAIEDGCALSFCYPRNPDHHDAPIHTVTPSALAWVDGTYYLLGRRAPHDPLSHFRVDRMTGVQAVAPSGRPRGQVPDAAPLSEAEAYVRTRCSMISGREERVRIRFHASLGRRL